MKEELSDSYPKINSTGLPVVVDKSTNKAEIDLILRQLFMLKQDTELIQNIMLGNNNFAKDASVKKDIGDFVENLSISDNSLEITEEIGYAIHNHLIGEISLKELEKEAIIRTLKFYNNNRRKTARSLGV